MVSTNQFPEVYTKTVEDHRGINEKVTTQLLSQKSAPNCEQKTFFVCDIISTMAKQVWNRCMFWTRKSPKQPSQTSTIPPVPHHPSFLIDIYCFSCNRSTFSQHFLWFFSLKEKSLHFHHLSKRPVSRPRNGPETLFLGPPDDWAWHDLIPDPAEGEDSPGAKRVP